MNRMRWAWSWMAIWMVLQASTSASGAKPAWTTLRVAPGGKLLLAGSQAGVQLYRLPSLRPVGRPWQPLPVVQQLRFSPTGKFLLVAGGKPAEQGRLAVYRWPELKLERRFAAGEDLVMDASWLVAKSESPGAAGERRIAAVGMDRQLRIFDVDSGNPIASVEGHSRGILSLVELPGLSVLVTGSLDNSLRLWKLGEQLAVESMLDNHRGGVLAMALRPGKAELPMVMSVSEDRTIRFWQPTIGRMVRFADIPARPLTAAWIAGGRLAVVAASDGELRVVNPETVEVVWKKKVIDGWAYSLAVLADGDKCVVGGSNGQLKLVDFPESLSMGAE